MSDKGAPPSIDAADNYMGVFLTHPLSLLFRLHTDWLSLCALLLYWLIRPLASFTLCEERIGDIVGLLKLLRITQAAGRWDR
jgi:hypothetical protein